MPAQVFRAYQRKIFVRQDGGTILFVSVVDFFGKYDNSGMVVRQLCRDAGSLLICPVQDNPPAPFIQSLIEYALRCLTEVRRFVVCGGEDRDEGFQDGTRFVVTLPSFTGNSLADRVRPAD